MQRALLFFLPTIVSLSSGSLLYMYNLQDDLKELYDVIPHEKYSKLIERYLHEDPDFANGVAFLQSPVWKNLIRSLQTHEEYKKLIKFLEESNLPVSVHLNYIFHLIETADTSLADGKSKGSFKNFLNEAIPLLPNDELVFLTRTKNIQSPEFQRLYLRLSSKEAQMLYNKVIFLPEMGEIISHLLELGLDQGWNNKKSSTMKYLK